MSESHDHPAAVFAPDLQSWIRNANLDPDWLRIGTDIVDGSPAPTFNGSFSLTGTVVPDCGATVALLGFCLARLGCAAAQIELLSPIS